jgi:hypothetical protein
MRLGSVGRAEEANRLDLDSHADCCVCGKEVLVFNDFDREVTVTGWEPERETQSLRIVSASLGYTMPQSGKTVVLQAIRLKRPSCQVMKVVFKRCNANKILCWIFSKLSYETLQEVETMLKNPI